MTNAEHLAVLRVILHAEPDRFPEVYDQIRAVQGRTGLGEVLAAAFYLAVRRQFRRRYHPENLIELVADMRIRFDRTGNMIDPYWSELCIRCALGEPGRLRYVPDSTAVTIHGMVCWYLTSQDRLGNPGTFICKVERLLDQWAADPSDQNDSERLLLGRALLWTLILLLCVVALIGQLTHHPHLPYVQPTITVGFVVLVLTNGAGLVRRWRKRRALDALRCTSREKDGHEPSVRPVHRVEPDPPQVNWSSILQSRPD